MQAVVAELDAEGLHCTSLTRLEIGFSARNAEEWDLLAGALRVFRVAEITESHLADAARTQRRLADQGLRGRKVPDLIIASVALAEGFVVLHYDRDFEHIADVTGQPHRWVVAAGSIN